MHFFRNLVNSWVVYVIIALILFGFIFFGFADMFVRPEAQGVIAKINGQPIMERQVQQQLINEKRMMQQQYGDQYDDTLFNAFINEQSVYRSIENNMLISQLADEMNLTVTEAQIQDYILNSPEFKDSQGRYSEQIATQTIQSYGFPSKQAFKQSVAQSLKVAQLTQALGGSVVLPPKAIEVQYTIDQQQRDYQYVSITPSQAGIEVEIDNAQIESYYQDNMDQFMTAETLDIDYFVVTLDAAESLDDFNNQLDTIQDLSFTGDPVAAIADQLGLTLTSAESVNPAQLEGELASAEVQAKLNEFDVRSGELSGYALTDNDTRAVAFQVVNTHEASAKPLDDVRGTISAYLKRSQEQQALEAQITKWLEAIKNSEQSFDALAKQLNLSIEQVTAVDRRDSSQPYTVNQAAFALTKAEPYGQATLSQGEARALIQLDNVIIPSIDTESQAWQSFYQQAKRTAAEQALMNAVQAFKAESDIDIYKADYQQANS